MKAQFVNENRGIPYSKIPGKDPVIGTIITKPMTFGEHEYPSTEMDVIEVSGDIYICNSWYKPGVPQVVHAEMVEEFIPLK